MLNIADVQTLRQEDLAVPQKAALSRGHREKARSEEEGGPGVADESHRWFKRVDWRRGSRDFSPPGRAPDEEDEDLATRRTRAMMTGAQSEW